VLLECAARILSPLAEERTVVTTVWLNHGDVNMKRREGMLSGSDIPID
jgi:hypothetical protein